jgi:cathepsin L
MAKSFLPPETATKTETPAEALDPTRAAFELYKNSFSPAAPAESGSARAAVRAVAFPRLKEELGAIEIPPEIPIEKIRKDCWRRMVKFQKELAAQREKARRKGGALITGDAFWQMIAAGSRQPGVTAQNAEYSLAPYLPYFDWRLAGIVPSARNQGKKCNSCWAFSATAAFESRLMYNVNRFKIGAADKGLAATQVALSVQKVLDCVTDGDCTGGFHTTAFEYFMKHGARVLKVDEQGFTFDDRKELMGRKGPCTEKGKKRVKAFAWDFVLDVPDVIPTKKADILRMKQALLEHGPLTVLVRINDDFNHYKAANYPKGVFDKDDKTPVNHAVVVVGWDDERRAWIILNSFGPKWGDCCIDAKKVEKLFPGAMANVRNHLQRERGCMYIAYGVSSIGKFAAWIEAPLITPKALEKYASAN